MTLYRLIEMTSHGLAYLYYKYCYRFSFLGRRVVFSSGIEIEGAEFISLGDNTKIGKDTWLRASPSLKKGPVISIGRNCDIGRRNMITAAGSVRIKNNVITGPNVVIADHNHQFSNPRVPIKDQGITEPKAVLIGSGTWIGANTVILAGSQIGKNVVIGAGSVVTGNIPDFSIAVGSPAKILKKVLNT